MKHVYKIFQILVLFLLCNNAIAQYCLPTYSTGCTFGDGLTLFQLPPVNQSITCTASYHDFTADVANLTVGVPATITMQSGYSGTYVNVYIDYNHNNTFDATELIGQVDCASSATNYTITFTVPGTALTGNTRLRALTEWIAYPSGPCTAQTYGNCEDFTVNITGASTPPTVNTTAATGITTTTATLNGTVNANGASTTVTFQYGLTVAYGSTITAAQSPVTGSTLTPVSGAIVALTPNTLYHYRAVGVNAGGTTNGSDMTFTTLGAIPTMVTTAATGITGISATLNGTGNANNNSTTTSFDYGLTIAYGSGIAGVPSPIAGTTVTGITAALGGLLPNTLYHYRLDGVNIIGPAYGNDMTFTTLQIPPAVTTTAATGVTATTATMNGTINANNLSTNSFFDYGLTVAYGSTVAGNPSIVNGTILTNVNYALTGLISNTTYHYRLRGVNGAGTVNGADQVFSTVCNVAGAAGAITGPGQVCNGGTGYVYSVPAIPNANSYAWTLPFGAVVTAGANTNTITVNFPNPSFNGNMTVYGVGCAGNGAPSTMVVVVNAAATPTLTGPTNVCLNSAGNVYTTEAGKTNYVWNIVGGSITSGGTSTSNTATVLWSTLGTQNINVNYNNAAGCAGLAPAVTNVTVNPLPVPVIAGNATPCTALTSVYTCQTGMSNYIWATTAGGQVVSGNGTSSATILWNAAGNQTVFVTFTNAIGCSNAAPATYSVTVKQGPTPTITGTGIACVNSGYYTYTTQPGMTGYTWTISSGGTLLYGATTNMITVNWTVPGAQWVTVNYTNTYGCPAPNAVSFGVSITDAPGPAGSITGSSIVCEGSVNNVYSIPAIPNTHSYIWTVPTGATIVSGLYSNVISVNFAMGAPSGNITVYGNSSCGNGSTSPAFPVTVNLKPGSAGTIVGPNALCQGTNGVEYSVPAITGATAYAWALPAGATIVSGGNTNDITVDFSMSAISGPITVMGTNSCGSGTVSPTFALTILITPQTPIITSSGPVLTSDAPAGNQWYLGGTIIPGETNQSYTATVNGMYYDVVTLNGCSSAPSNQIDVVNIGIQNIKGSVISVYPVPNEGVFNVTITSGTPENYSISVENNLGVQVYLQKDIMVSGSVQRTIDLRPVANGVYTVIFTNNQNRVVKKVIVNK
jgi:large repetitive protein